MRWRSGGCMRAFASASVRRASIALVVGAVHARGAAAQHRALADPLVADPVRLSAPQRVGVRADAVARAIDAVHEFARRRGTWKDPGEMLTAGGW